MSNAQLMHLLGCSEQDLTHLENGEMVQGLAVLGLKMVMCACNSRMYQKNPEELEKLYRLVRIEAKAFVDEKSLKDTDECFLEFRKQRMLKC